MKSIKSLSALGLFAAGLLVLHTAEGQVYQFTTPLVSSSYMTIHLTDRPSGLSANYTEMLSTLTETVYLDLNAKTMRQVGLISVAPASQQMTIHESGALVTLTAGPAGGAISFDTGPRALTPISGGYSLNANIGDLAMTGSYSVAVNDGEYFSGTLNYVMHETVDSVWSFSRVLTAGAPNSITLQSLGNFGGTGYYYEQDVLANISAANGFSLQITSGGNVVPGYGPGDDLAWNSGSVTALMVPEPACATLAGLGLVGLFLFRRR